MKMNYSTQTTVLGVVRHTGQSGMHCTCDNDMLQLVIYNVIIIFMLLSCYFSISIV